MAVGMDSIDSSIVSALGRLHYVDRYRQPERNHDDFPYQHLMDAEDMPFGKEMIIRGVSSDWHL